MRDLLCENVGQRGLFCVDCRASHRHVAKDIEPIDRMCEFYRPFIVPTTTETYYGAHRN